MRTTHRRTLPIASRGRVNVRANGLVRGLVSGAVCAVVGGAVLAACSFSYDINIVNTCGVPVAIGVASESDPGLAQQFSLDEAGRAEIYIAGYSKFDITVVPAEAELVADPTEVNAGKLPEVIGPEGYTVSELDLSEAGLCPE